MCCVPDKGDREIGGKWLPSPGGDVLCLTAAEKAVASLDVFPSPGGDVLCRQFLIKKRKKKFDFLWE